MPLLAASSRQVYNATRTLLELEQHTGGMAGNLSVVAEDTAGGLGRGAMCVRVCAHGWVSGGAGGGTTGGWAAHLSGPPPPLHGYAPTHAVPRAPTREGMLEVLASARIPISVILPDPGAAAAVEALENVTTDAISVVTTALYAAPAELDALSASISAAGDTLRDNLMKVRWWAARGCQVWGVIGAPAKCAGRALTRALAEGSGA